MENFEKDMKLVLASLDDAVSTQREEKQDTAEKSGTDLTSSTTTVADKSSEKKVNLCAVCDAEGEKTCGACKSVSYCSVEHQRLHWKSHKKVCSPFIIKQTETMGKGWIAARDLPADTILLEELPVLSGPQLDELLSTCCLTCGVVMMNPQNENRKCSTCSWPICSAKCEKSSLHAENECKFLSTHEMTPSNSGEISAWTRSRILLIRASNLKLKNKNLFDKMMKLQDFSVLPNRNHKLNIEAFFTRLEEEFILSRTELTGEEYLKLVRIFKVNCFATPATTASETSAEMLVLYLQSSRMNHSCVPNCILSPGPSPDFKARIRTAVAVKKGESLLISYYDKMPLEPTSIRQQYLQNKAGFMCKCERCLDPTELGTFLSGIKCPSFRCQKSKRKQSGDGENSDSDFGYFLPENPLDLSFDSETGSLTSDPLFKCNGCGETKFFSVLKSNLPSEIRRAFDFDLSENVENAEAFLAKYDLETGGKYLHKNHHLIYTLIGKILPTRTKVLEQGLNKLEAEQVVRRLEYVLQIQHMLFPGLSLQKTVLFDHLMWTVCHLLLEFANELGAQEKAKLVLTGQTCYKEGMKFLKNDNNGEAESMIQNLESVFKFINTLQLVASLIDSSN